MPEPTTALTYGAVVAAIMAIVGFARVVRDVIRAVWPYVMTFRQFLEDWRGEAARPGFAGHPGVPARLEAVESSSSAVLRRLEQVDGSSRAAQATAEQAFSEVMSLRLDWAAVTEQLGLIAAAVGQLLPNGGSTLNDAIHRIEKDTARTAGRTSPIARDPGGTK